MHKLILASRSAIRVSVLSRAGLKFECIPADIDETGLIEAGMKRGDSLETLAKDLAQAKALHISKQHDGVVIGADQILGFENKPYEKCATLQEAAKRLALMAGKTHYLHAGIALTQGTKTLWAHCETSKLNMRALTLAEIDNYLEAVGEQVLSSVGAYQLEKQGSRLFEHIDGDYFSILGLPLLPLLAQLRAHKIIAW